ncbi:hypothetical protein V8C37DRAFT_255131 [Trichoderma ceciliae]
MEAFESLLVRSLIFKPRLSSSSPIFFFLSHLPLPSSSPIFLFFLSILCRSACCNRRLAKRCSVRSSLSIYCSCLLVASVLTAPASQPQPLDKDREVFNCQRASPKPCGSG